MKSPTWPQKQMKRGKVSLKAKGDCLRGGKITVD